MECEATRLMVSAKAGDPAAFDQLVERVRGRAFRFAQSLVGSREDAMELTQDAFLKTYKARETFREGEPFLPWFHRILRNTCYTFLRKHRRLKKHSIHAKPDEDDSEWQIEGNEPGPDAPAQQGEAVAVLREALELLSARDREILALRHFEELAYKDIATTLGIPEGTVMSRLFHARRRLKDRLLPHLDGPLSEFEGAGNDQ